MTRLATLHSVLAALHLTWKEPRIGTRVEIFLSKSAFKECWALGLLLWESMMFSAERNM